MNAIEIAFEGRLGGAPTVRTSQAGKQWCALSVVHGKDTEATWLSVAVFGSHVETVAALEKGALVYVEGRLTLDTWTDKEGRERSGLKVAASLVQPLGQIGRRKPAKPHEATSAVSAGSRSDLVYKTVGASLAGGSTERRYSGPDSEIPF